MRIPCDHHFEVGGEMAGATAKRFGRVRASRQSFSDSGKSSSAVHPPALASETGYRVTALLPLRLALVEVPAPVLVVGDALLTRAEKRSYGFGHQPTLDPRTLRKKQGGRKVLFWTQSNRCHRESR